MSDITCVPYQKKDFASWNEFVVQSNNGTLFHRLDFLAYHQARFEPNAAHLRFLKKDHCVGVLPLGLFEDEEGAIAKSPFGASFGGLVTNPDCSLTDMESMVAALGAYLKERKIKRLRIVQPPLIYYGVPEDYFDFCLLKHGARITTSDLTSYVKARENALDGFLPRARRDTQKAIIAGLEVRESDDVTAFYDILMENMKKFGGTPTHTSPEIRWLIKNLPEDIKIYHVMQDGQAVASSLIFYANARAWLVFYWAQRQDSTLLHPKNFLIMKLSELARQRGVAYIDFGPQTLDMEPFYGVTMFKESLGGRGLLRRTYLWDL
ncbi:MAG: GNAT family N-acetyltransferase [Candidatus Omnitrophica bacterium]|nr:GNAT family N-acetyltransferase [Candidatus Omnitrophota bacterium]